MQSMDEISEARRLVEICNACRYCESFCAVFPALERNREFTDPDITYLANLCHGCQGCYYACQYAPPHEWGVNLPVALAQVRYKSYEHYAWPRPLAALFQSNGVVLSFAMACGIALVLSLVTLFGQRPLLAVSNSFYQVIPLIWMQTVALVTVGFSLFSLAVSLVSFWRDVGTGRIGLAAFGRGAWDVLTLKNLGGAGHGCNDRDETFSMTRRWLHQAMMYGFLLCIAATTVAFIYNDFLGWVAPYPLFSLPVILGTLGGIGLSIGAIGLFVVKFNRNPETSPRNLLGADVALLLLLALAALSGLALLALRSTGAMSVALAIHLGIILAFFVTVPYSKMVHAMFRFAALVRNAAESHLLEPENPEV